MDIWFKLRIKDRGGNDHLIIKIRHFAQRIGDGNDSVRRAGRNTSAAIHAQLIRYDGLAVFYPDSLSRTASHAYHVAATFFREHLMCMVKFAQFASFFDPKDYSK